MKEIRLTNTHLALILPQIGLSIPFSIFWLRASFRSIPKALSEAAMIEGASQIYNPYKNFNTTNYASYSNINCFIIYVDLE